MRFEFNSDNVSTLIDMIYDISESIKSTHTNAMTAYLNRIRNVAKKIKVYSADAFETRERYRIEMQALFSVLDDIAKQMKVV
jgi:hypothetical protein